MGERIEGLARVLRRLNGWVTPAPLGRLDQWLLMHRPLVWRTRLHWVAWWALLASLGLAVLGLLTHHTPADAPSPAELAVSLYAVLYVTAVVAIWWVVLQLRTPLGEVGLRRHSRLLLLNMSAIGLLLVPTAVLGLATTFAVASSMPDADFARDQLFHHQHDYWQCRFEQEPPHSDDDSEARAKLATFGATPDPEQAGCSARKDGQKLTIALDDAASLELQLRLDGIDFAKAFWHHGTRQYRDEADSSVGVAAALALSISVLLGAFSHPAYAWRRFPLELNVRRRSVARARASRWWLSTFDHWLLVRWPLVWVARLHVYLFAWLCASVLCVLAGPVLARCISDLPSTAFTTTLVLAAIWPWFWLLLRREDLTARGGCRWQPLASGIFAAAALVPVGMIATGYLARHGSLENPLLDYGNIVALGCAIIGAWFAVAYAGLRIYESRVAALVLVMVALFAMGVSFVLAFNVLDAPSASLTSVFVFWAMVAFVVLTSCARSEAVGKAQRLLAASLIIATPTVLFTCTLVSLASFLSALSAKIAANGWLLTFLCGCLFYVLCVFAVEPFSQVLRRAKYEPTPQ